MNMVKPCSKDSKNIVFNAFKHDFDEVNTALALEATIDEQQAEMVLLELGFINEK